MALVNCTECNGTVSDTASACPHCGAPTPGGKTSTITVTRKKAFTGFGNSVEVAVDGQGVASLSQGQSFSVDVAAGEHRVEVETMGPLRGRPQVFTFTIARDQKVAFEAGFTPMGFYVKGV